MGTNPCSQVTKSCEKPEIRRVEAAAAADNVVRMKNTHIIWVSKLRCPYIFGHIVFVSALNCTLSNDILNNEIQ